MTCPDEPIWASFVWVDELQMFVCTSAAWFFGGPSVLARLAAHRGKRSELWRTTNARLQRRAAIQKAREQRINEHR